MTGFPHTFGSLSGEIALSFLDDNFAVCAFASDLTTLEAEVTALPAITLPIIPVPGGAIGVSATLAHADHQHPMQPATKNTQAGTSYTIAASDNGLVLRFTNAATITVTVPNSLSADFSCLVYQAGAGQVTFVAGSGATQEQRQGLTKTAGQWAAVSVIGDSNAGSALVYVLSGDMA